MECSGDMIDWSRVNELRLDIGAGDFDDVVELFLDEVETEIATLHAISERQALAEKLHFLKGSAINLGFAAFSQLCQRGELSAAGGSPDSVDLAGIIDSYHVSKARFLDGLKSGATE